MPASRLSEGQRAEMVEKFRQGVATVVLANTYDCSPNTVSRLVKAAMDGEEYERLKRQRQRRADVMDEPASELDAPLDLAADLQAAGSQLPLDPSPGAAVQQPEPSPESSRQPELPGLLEISSAEPAPPPPRPEVLSPQSSSSAPSPTLAEAPALAVAPEVPSPLELEPPQEAEPSVLAIEDADDFGDDEDDDDLSGDDDLNEDDLFGDGSQPLNEVFLPVPLLQIGIEATATGPLAWGSAALPSSAYMLVEKTVELQPQVLRELPELGQLPEDEQERQALVLFVNPRQAKRQCGRNQRVIRIPDIQVFELTAPKLVAQGITRVVVEGSLFALPGC
ncbi:MAG: hypothetical protein ACK52U_03675 [Synechococcaceae cyanobacterium]